MISSAQVTVGQIDDVGIDVAGMYCLLDVAKCTECSDDNVATFSYSGKGRRLN